MSTKVTWLGEEAGPDEIEVHGQTFKAGKAVDVSDDMAIRLMGNPFFKRDDGKPSVVEKMVTENQAAAAQAKVVVAPVKV